MTEIVTLEEAKLFCRVTNDMEDQTFAVLIGAATEAALAVADDWDGTGEVPHRLKLAVLVRVAEAYDNRETLENNGKGELGLLSPLRKLEV